MPKVNILLVKPNYLHQSLLKFIFPLFHPFKTLKRFQPAPESQDLLLVVSFLDLSLCRRAFCPAGVQIRNLSQPLESEGDPHHV